MFFCSRSYHCSDMRLVCTRVNISHQASSDYINKKLFVPITDFHLSFREGIVIMEKIYFFVHYDGTLSRKEEDRERITTNFGVLYQEYITTPLLLWKMYLDIMCRIIYNIAYKEIFPLLLSELRDDCRDFSVCNNENCPDRKKNKVKYIF